MSTSYSAALNMQQPAVADPNWGPPLLTNITILDSQNAIGDLAVATAEVPSASLNVKVSAGNVIAQDGSVITYAGIASQAIPASSSKILYLDGTSSWALTIGTSYPTTPHVKLASIVTGLSTITSIADGRVSSNVSGSIADGVNYSLGTVTGTAIGTTALQKLSFFGATPVVQQTGGVATASGSWTSVEEGMLNRAYSALRTLGLLS